MANAPKQAGPAKQSGASSDRRDRGVETRAQLVEAALDVFGRRGYEGAATREIAKAANANLAAIVYHFGSKEALHIAVAEHVVRSILAKAGPALAAADDPMVTENPGAARTALEGLVATMVDVMLGSAEAERWARFIVREQLQPTAAFDVIYQFMGGVTATAARLVATIRNRPVDEKTRLWVFTMMGQVMVFRVAQALVLRQMRWPEIGEHQRSDIKRVILENLDTLLTGRRP